MSKGLESGMEPITRAHMERFHGLAESVLARTDSAAAIEELGRSLSWFVAGAIPLFGLAMLDWSPQEWLLFVLAGAWIGIACDCAKLHYLRAPILETAERAYDDNFVWTIVDALRSGEHAAPMEHLRGRYNPRAGVLIDLGFGGIGTLLVVLLLPYSLGELWSSSPALRWSVLSFALYRLLFAAWEIVAHRTEGTAPRSVRVAIGLRGVGLFLLAFLTAMVFDVDQNGTSLPEQGGRWMMGLVNLLAVAAAAGNVWGVAMTRANARWLGEYLGRRNATRGVKVLRTHR